MATLVPFDRTLQEIIQKILLMKTDKKKSNVKPENAFEVLPYRIMDILFGTRGLRLSNSNLNLAVYIVAVLHLIAVLKITNSFVEFS